MPSDIPTQHITPLTHTATRSRLSSEKQLHASSRPPSSPVSPITRHTFSRKARISPPSGYATTILEGVVCLSSTTNGQYFSPCKHPPRSYPGSMTFPIPVHILIGFVPYVTDHQCTRSDTLYMSVEDATMRASSEFVTNTTRVCPTTASRDQIAIHTRVGWMQDVALSRFKTLEAHSLSIAKARPMQREARREATCVSPVTPPHTVLLVHLETKRHTGTDDGTCWGRMPKHIWRVISCYVSC